MSSLTEQENDEQKEPIGRANVIAAVVSPLNLLVLGVLVCEAILLVLAHDADEHTKSLITRFMLGILTGLIAVAIILSVLKPEIYESEASRKRKAEDEKTKLSVLAVLNTRGLDVENIMLRIGYEADNTEVRRDILMALQQLWEKGRVAKSQNGLNWWIKTD